MEKQPIWTIFWAKIPQTGYSVCLGRRATGGPGGGGAPRQWAAREADYGGKASISVRSSLQWAEGTTSATIKRTTLSYTYLGYIKYPTYPVQCSKTAVFSGLEWNFWFEKIYFFEKTCEMTAVTLVTICTYVAKHIEFADLLRYFAVF